MASYLYFDSGGRPYNGQDFSAMQNLVIDSTQIYGAFTGDYIINGCTPVGTAGSVWLSGKIRDISANPSITTFPAWIVAQDSQISRIYKDGSSKIAFNVYSAIWSSVAPNVGVAAIQFNSQSDLNNIRLTRFLSVDAVPTEGGSYTGAVNAPSYTTNGGLGANLFGETVNDNGRYRLGVGMNLQYTGSNWLAMGDGSHNGAAIAYSDIFGGGFNIGVYPSNGGVNRVLSPTDIDAGVKLSVDSSGNVTATGNINGSTITASTALAANTINMSKKQITPGSYGVSTINFAAEVNDPGYISHSENSDAAIMTFVVSDDASGDYFTFGSTPVGVYNEAMRINTNGSATLTGAWTAADFIIPSDQLLKENIIDITNGLDIINSLRAVEYDMISTKQHRSGFIAQEVNQVIKHAVLEPQDIDDYYKLSETQIIPYLVKAVQELSARVQELEKQLSK